MLYAVEFRFYVQYLSHLSLRSRTQLESTFDLDNRKHFWKAGVSK